MSRKAIHPLIAALIDELPARGAEFPEDKRHNWLNMMAMSLGTIYGGAASPVDALADKLFRSPPPKPAAPAKRATPSYPFIVDEQGYARNGKTKDRILPTQVSDILFDLRGIDGDAAAIVWADDSKGLNGANITIALG